MKAVHMAVALALVTALAAAGAAAAATRSSARAKVGSARTGLGRVAADAGGRTLYLFERDERGRSSCSGLCTTYWPPLLTRGKPLALHGVKQSLLGSTRRSDGRRQVTLAGHPVYRFSGDAGRGQTNGEGLQDFGAAWEALSPSGKKIEKDG